MPLRSALARLARDPVARFIVLGVALFAIHRFAARASDSRSDPRQITVGRAFVQRLARDHEQRTGRRPTEAELREIVDRHVLDEILLREAFALGLDRGDPIVRRRLVQRMGFVVEDVVSIPEPSDSELAAYLARNRDTFARPDSIDLLHVFFSRDRRGAAASDDAVAALGALGRGSDPSDVGDAFPLSRVVRGEAPASLRSAFGAAFADLASSVPIGTWRGPVESRYGVHLVRVTRREPGEVPTLDRIRTEVRAAFIGERRSALNRAALAKLRARYRVHIEVPASAPSRDRVVSAGDAR